MMRATNTGVRDTDVVIPWDPPAGEPARLSFDNGLEHYRLAADPRLATLLQAHFAEPPPVVWATGHAAHVEYPVGSRLLRRMGRSEIRLHPGVPWSLEVHGGAAHLDADLADLRLRAVTFHGSLAHSTIALSRPIGPCMIRLGAVKELRIVRPADVPVRVEIAKGSTNVRLDGRRFGAVGKGLADQAAGYDTAQDRYLIIATGGVDGLTITYTSPASAEP